VRCAVPYIAVSGFAWEAFGYHGADANRWRLILADIHDVPSSKAFPLCPAMD